ncbi:MAG TPA: (Fe-S)-binding protein [Capsulimonadaceae bacterium]|jgi:L-lactate dehydrogenase complex protein LldE
MRVALFVTCLVDQYFPKVAEAVVDLLAMKGVTVAFPARQTCCGQPAFNNGYTAEARTVGKTLVQAFDGFTHVVTPSGSCAGMIRHYYPELFAGTPDHEAATALAAKTYEFTEFVTHVLGDPDFGAIFPHRAVYHTGCHGARLLGLRDEPLELLAKVKELDLVPLPFAQDCCGFGGTFAVKFANLSVAMATEKARNVTETGANVLVGTDVGCLMNIGGVLRRQDSPIRVLHLAELLHEGTRR